MPNVQYANSVVTGASYNFLTIKAHREHEFTNTALQIPVLIIRARKDFSVVNAHRDSGQPTCMSF